MPRKVLEWIKCLDLAQQALLIIFSQTTTTRLSKELLACIWPDTHSKKQKSNPVLVHGLLSSSASKCEFFVCFFFTCDWLLFPPPPPPPPPVPPPVPPPPALLGCWWLAISAILLSICSKRSRIDILNWLSDRKGRGGEREDRSVKNYSQTLR